MWLPKLVRQRAWTPRKLGVAGGRKAMLRIGVKTRQNSNKVRQSAIQFFGPEGEGLKIADQRDNPPAIPF
jgi:hypothetical protein